MISQNTRVTKFRDRILTNVTTMQKSPNDGNLFKYRLRTSRIYKKNIET